MFAAPSQHRPCSAVPAAPSLQRRPCSAIPAVSSLPCCHCSAISIAPSQQHHLRQCRASSAIATTLLVTAVVSLQYHSHSAILQCCACSANLGAPIPAAPSLQCQPCSPIPAAPSLQHNPCSAVRATPSLQHQPGNAVPAAVSSQYAIYKTCDVTLCGDDIAIPLSFPFKDGTTTRWAMDKMQRPLTCSSPHRTQCFFIRRRDPPRAEPIKPDAMWSQRPPLLINKRAIRRSSFIEDSDSTGSHGETQYRCSSGVQHKASFTISQVNGRCVLIDATAPPIRDFWSHAEILVRVGGASHPLTSAGKQHVS